MIGQKTGKQYTYGLESGQVVFLFYIFTDMQRAAAPHPFSNYSQKKPLRTAEFLWTLLVMDKEYV
jgi:hypothetical protein